MRPRPKSGIESLADAKHFTQEAKDDALTTAIEIDRGLTQATVAAVRDKQEAERKRLYAEFTNKKVDDLPEYYDDDIDNLPFALQVQLNDVRKSIFTSPFDFIVLDGYVKIINVLLEARARNSNNDWTDIYCRNCKFPFYADFRGSHFDRSYLRDSTLAHLSLVDSTFVDADLGGANFFGSDLSNADLHWGDIPDSFKTHLNYSDTTFPYIECATLTGANLTGLPLITIQHQLLYNEGYPNPTFGVASLPSVNAVVFDTKTKIDRVGVKTTTTFDETYIDKIDAESKKQFEQYVLGDQQGQYSIGEFGDIHISPIVTDSTMVQGQKKFYSLDRTRYDVIDIKFRPFSWSRPIFDVMLQAKFWRNSPVVEAILSDDTTAGHKSKDAVSVHEESIPYVSCIKLIPEQLELERHYYVNIK